MDATNVRARRAYDHLAYQCEDKCFYLFPQCKRARFVIGGLKVQLSLDQVDTAFVHLWDQFLQPRYLCSKADQSVEYLQSPQAE